MSMIDSTKVKRRSFLLTGTGAFFVVAAGCSEPAADLMHGSSATDSEGDPELDTEADSTGDPGEPLPDAGAGDNRAPEWSTIPDQVWIVGVPVHFDLADYVTDVDGDALAFALSPSLPPGLTLEGSVITGTPTAVFAEASFTATADDGEA